MSLKIRLNVEHGPEVETERLQGPGDLVKYKSADIEAFYDAPYDLWAVHWSTLALEAICALYAPRHSSPIWIRMSDPVRRTLQKNCSSDI